MSSAPLPVTLGYGGPAAASRVACAVLLAALVAGCSAPTPGDRVHVREVTPEFLSDRPATDAVIAADTHGRVALTFVTRDSSGQNLWLSVSRDSGLGFSPPLRVNHRPGSVRSEIEGRPMVAFGPRGELAVAWSEQRSDTSRALDLVVCASGDGGGTLSPPIRVNDDLAPDPALSWSIWWRWHQRWNDSAFHGFPALAFLPDGSLFAAWVNGRESRPEDLAPAEAALYGAISSNGGWSWGANTRFAGGACADARPTALADPSGRVAVAYRTARDGRRAPALAVSFDGGRTFPLDTVISADEDFEDDAQARGPGLSWNALAGGSYAWHAATRAPGVYLVPWHPDHGTAGVKRSLMDSLATAERPRLATLGAATLIAVEARPAADTTRHVLAVRVLEADGSLSPWCFLGADIRGGWIAAIDPHTAIACWTEREEKGPRLRVARLRWTGGHAGP